MDIKDSKHDKKRMQEETTVINLPEVKDIPGQKNFDPIPPGEPAVPTAASADEEGEGLLDDLNTGEENDTTPLMDDNSNVTREERQDLYNSANVTPYEQDAENLSRAQLDSTDEDGTPLEEKSRRLSGSDLDVPTENE